ncbi:MAG: oligosaccharide flippase family protein [Flavobacterium sp.]|nr:oligosaccharide flippase family protein [Flavobacterium sp.]
MLKTENDSKSLQYILFNTLYTKTVLLIIAFLIALILVYTIPIFAEERKMFFLSFTIVFAQVFNPIWYLQGLEDFKTSSVLNVVSKLSYVLLVFCFIKVADDYVYVNSILGLTALFFNLIGLIIIKKRYDFKLIYPSFNIIKKTLINDFSFSISQLFLSLRQLSPLFLASYFLVFILAGQYKFIEQIISFFRTFIQVYLKFFFPKLCYKIIISIQEAMLFWKKYRLLLLLGVVSVLILIYFSRNTLYVILMFP